MKPWGVVVAVMLTATAACGAGSSATKGGDLLCGAVTDGAVKVQDVIDGSKNGTMTDADAAAAMGKAAGHFNDAVSIGGRDQHLVGLARDAALQAGQMRVSLLGDGATVGSNTTALINDLNEAEADCNINSS